MIAAVIAGVAVSSEAEKYLAKDVFFIAPCLNDNKFYFSAEEVAELRSACQLLMLATISLDNAAISYGDISAYAKIIYSGSDCFYLNNIKFSEGGAWGADRDNWNSAVISESLAWQLFGSLKVVDKTMTVGDALYTVSGVARQGRLSREGCTAYLPAAAKPAGQGASSVLLQVPAYNKLGLYLQISGWLEAISKNPGDYYITDMNRYLENIALKYKLLLLLIALYVATAIVINSCRLIKYRRSQDNNPARFAIMLGIIAALDIVLIVALLNGVSFSIWLPHGADSRLGELFRAIANSGFLPSAEYLLLNLAKISRLNVYANGLLIAGAAALFNFVFVHKSGY